LCYSDQGYQMQSALVQLLSLSRKHLNMVELHKQLICQSLGLLKICFFYWGLILIVPSVLGSYNRRLVNIGLPFNVEFEPHQRLISFNY